MPFNINMVDFDTELLKVVNVWLWGSSASNDMRLMLIANDIKTYDNFRCLTPVGVSALDRVSNRATVKLKEVHAIRVNEMLSYISFIETSDETLADDPLQ